MGMLTLILMFAVVFGRVMVREGVAQGFAAAFLGAFQNKYLAWLMLDILMLISGMFCDDIILLLVVIPLVMPLTSQMGVDIVQIGAIIVLTVGIGKGSMIVAAW